MDFSKIYIVLLITACKLYPIYDSLPDKYKQSTTMSLIKEVIDSDFKEISPDLTVELIHSITEILMYIPLSVSQFDIVVLGNEREYYVDHYEGQLALFPRDGGTTTFLEEDFNGDWSHKANREFDIIKVHRKHDASIINLEQRRNHLIELLKLL